MMLTVILFWICAGGLFYVYLGYPLLVFIIGYVFRRTVRKAPISPRVTLIIPAYNEEKFIRETLENKLQLDYPKDRLEIIVVSDASDDGTNLIVQEYGVYGVKLIVLPERKGKTVALNKAVCVAKGEILVFSDANSLYRRDALKHLVANFGDPRVGYVTGQLVYQSASESLVGMGCSVYMKYENLLRIGESRFNSLVGVNGGIDASRKRLYRQMEPDQQPDLVLPLRVVEQGYRVVFDPLAKAREGALNRVQQEYRMRVRVALRALNAIRDMKHLLNPFRYGIFTWQLLSHKVMRYGSFIFLIGVFVLSFPMARHGTVFELLLFVQCLFYAAVFLLYTIQSTFSRFGQRSVFKRGTSVPGSNVIAIPRKEIHNGYSLKLCM